MDPVKEVSRHFLRRSFRPKEPVRTYQHVRQTGCEHLYMSSEVNKSAIDHLNTAQFVCRECQWELCREAVPSAVLPERERSIDQS